jgi:hypothetical protein
MSKKTLILTSAILILFFIVLAGYFFIINNNGNGDDNEKLSFRSFLPFGGSGGSSDNESENSSNQGNQSGNSGNNQSNSSDQNYNNQGDYVKKLRKLSEEPVSGAGTYDVKAGTIVRYIEKATGHIYEIEMFSPKKVRISNTTIPLAYSALWGNKASSIFASYINSDNLKASSYLLSIKNSTSTENMVSAIQLAENIYSSSVFGANVFYLQNENGVSNGYISSFDGTKRKLIWTSEFSDFISQYVNEKTVTLNTKPGPGIDGYLYKVDTATGKTKKILGGIPGLTSLVNFDESKVLYLQQNGNNMLSIYDQKTKTSDDLGFVTFPEKCVWSKKNTGLFYCGSPRIGIPADGVISWYKGQFQSSDAINFYNTKTKYLNQIVDLNLESKEDIDVINPMLSENENYLIFMNKRDGSLWSYDISGTDNVSTTTQATN